MIEVCYLGPHQVVVKGALRDDDVHCLSVCLSPVTHMWGLYGNCQTNQRKKLQYFYVITNPRWRTAANTKIVMSAYISVQDDLIMMTFGTQVYDENNFTKI